MQLRSWFLWRWSRANRPVRGFRQSEEALCFLELNNDCRSTIGPLIAFLDQAGKRFKKFLAQQHRKLVTQMAFNKGVRIRLSFEEDGMLSEEQIEQGLNKSWYLVNPQLSTIGQLSSWIAVDFRLGNSCPNGVTLEMSGFALPPTQPTALLQDAELVSVKRKRRSTGEELVSVAALAPSTFIAKTGGKENGAHFGGVKIRPLDALELETRSNQSEIVEKGGNRTRFKAVEIGLQLLRTKETIRRRKRMHETDIEQRGKETSAWKSDETDPDETEPDDDEDLERLNRKDAMQSSGDESLSRPGDQLERRPQIKEEVPSVGQIDGLSTSMSEDRKGGCESGGEKEVVDNPGDRQLIVAPSLHSMGQPIQERHLHHQKNHTSGREQTSGSRSSRDNPSEGNDTWCRNRFDVWRKQQGMDINKSIEDMPFEELGALLSRFFLMICKDNGQRYPSASLMNLYMSFNRIIGKAQQERARRLGVQEEPFKIQTHPSFQKATQSCHKAMELSRFSGVNKRPKKAACISLEVEKQILAHPEHQVTFPTGVQKRLAYYLWTVFLIRGNEEMWNLKFQDFSICVDEKGVEFLQYNARAARKQFKVIMTKAQEKLLQPPVFSYEADVIQTFKVLALHMPPDSESGHLFLSSIKDARTLVWFKQGVNVSKGMIRLWMNTMTEVVGLDAEGYSSKSKRVNIVTH